MKTRETLLAHVNSHCRYTDDQTHHVPPTFFTTFHRKFCITCSTHVPMRPRGHFNHQMVDCMPLPISDTTPAQVPTSTNLSINGSLKLPMMEDILDGTIHTTRHVPKNCRSKLAKALTEVCNAITKNPSHVESYKLLFMFPSCCLRAPPRTSRQKRN